MFFPHRHALVYFIVGPISDIRILKDKVTGIPKGIGFVDFQAQQSATAAMENMDNFNFHGKAIRVTYAEVKQPKHEDHAHAYPPPGYPGYPPYNPHMYPPSHDPHYPPHYPGYYPPQ